MTKKRARQYWKMLAGLTNISDAEAVVLSEAIKVLNEK